MEERSLRVYADKTFFTRITNTLTKMLIPTKIGINGMIISMKRNNIIKSFELYQNIDTAEQEKKEQAENKYEEAYSLYLEAIDKNVMDSVYKKVKNGTATDFEKDALSKYYNIVRIKDTQYVEYKYRKQKYLLEIDYETVKASNKSKLIEKYEEFYVNKMDSFYKGLLKHYSVRLADNLTTQAKDGVYESIFSTLEEYITVILPIKIEVNNNNTYKEVIEEYEKFQGYEVGKLDQNENIEKKMALIALSRKLFTHSLPLIAAEQCYIKLLKDARSLIVDTKMVKKREKAYALLIKIIEEYNLKLLSTKVYWDNQDKKEVHKELWNQYQNIEKIKDSNEEEYIKQKQILFIKADLKQVYYNENKYYKIINFYKNKLVELGAMKEIKNQYKSVGCYTGERIALCRN